MDIHCWFCGDPIQNPNDPTLWHRVEAWERVAGTRPSGKQGGSDVVLREPKPGLAHAGCVTLKRQGLLGQETLETA